MGCSVAAHEKSPTGKTAGEASLNGRGTTSTSRDSNGDVPCRGCCVSFFIIPSVGQKPKYFMTYSANEFVDFMFDEGDLITLRPIETWTDGHGNKTSQTLHNEHRTISREEFRDEFPKHLAACEKGRANVFYGVCPRFGRHEQKTSFEKRWQIRKANFFWLDIDHVTPEEAMERIAKSQVPEPSVVVATGNGVHCYWRLAQSLKFAQEDPPVLKSLYINGKLNVWYKDDHANYFVNDGVKLSGIPTPDMSGHALDVEDINSGLAELLGGDNTNDVSRILRLPDTMNRKNERNGDEPKPCEIYQFTGKTYSIEDFDFAIEVSPSRKRREAIKVMGLPDATITEKNLGKKRKSKLQEFLDDLAVVGEGERSDVDWKLMCWAVEEGIDPEFIWSKVDGLSKFEARGRQYFETTLVNAQGAVKTRRYEAAQERQARVEADITNGKASIGEVTELKLAQRLAEKHRGRLRYLNDVGTKGEYYFYDGTRWRSATISDIQPLVVDVIHECVRYDVADWECLARIKSIAELGKGLPELSDLLSNFDQDPMLFNIANGTVHLFADREPVVMEHSADDRLTQIAPVVYDPDAKCERFESFLEEICVDPESQEHNELLALYVRMIVSQCLDGESKLQRLPIFFGGGQNGKGTFFRLLAAVFGPDYMRQPQSDLLIKAAGYNASGPNPELMDLRGARLVVAQEFPDDQELNSTLIKNLTGTDEISVRNLYDRDKTDIKPTWTIALCTNNKPTVRDKSVGMWRRLRCVPFAKQIDERDRDEDLTEKLVRESSGVLNWLLQGYTYYHMFGIVEPPIVERESASYEFDSNTVSHYLNEMCVREVGERVLFPVLYDSFMEFCQLIGEPVMTKKGFGKALSAQGVGRKESNSKVYRTGIRIKDDADHTMDLIRQDLDSDA